MARRDNEALHPVIVSYRRALLVIFAFLPLLAILYLHFYQDPSRTFEHHTFHVIAISIAVLIGLFVCYVTWRCYLATGEVFLRWLTLGFLGFCVIYAPHGLLTPLAHHNPWLFLLFGPVSRLVMACCFLLAVLRFDAEADSAGQRRQIGPWLWAIGIFLFIDLLVIVWAVSSWQASALLRIGMEYGSIIILLLSMVWILFKRLNNPMMIIYVLALAWFAQSSLSFTYGLAWNHQWWLAHLIFAGGFLLLSFGVVQAWQSTRSFAHVYSQDELLQQLRQEKQRAEKALVDLQHANQELERLAATDSLTGVANRRALLAQAEREIIRANRQGSPLSLALLDLDYFKAINDQYGHPVGDAVLRMFVAQARGLLRPEDVLGRMGGEEFAVLLPQANRQGAMMVIERLRSAIAAQPLVIDGATIDLRFSGGLVSYSREFRDVDEWLKVADRLLYQAKKAGRNQVVAQ